MEIKNATLYIHVPYEIPIIDEERMDPAMNGIHTQHAIKIDDNKRLEEISKMFIDNVFDFTDELCKTIIPAWIGLESAIKYNKTNSIQLSIRNHMNAYSSQQRGSFELIFIQQEQEPFNNITGKARSKK